MGDDFFPKRSFKVGGLPPPQPSTKPLPKVEVPQGQLDAVLLELRIMREEGKAARDELRALRTEVKEERERNDRHSDGVKQLSHSDNKQDATIGAILVDVEHLKKEQARVINILERIEVVLEKLERVAANPLVRRIAYTIGAGLLAWLAHKGKL